MLLRLAVLAAVAWATTAHSAHKSHDDAKPDCLQAGDGYYVAGCSAKFWRCVNDRLYNYDCPKGLYFNPLKRKCEYKTDVPICTPGVKVDSANVIKASAEFNCTDLADGPYKPRDIACSNTFITCFSGMAVEQACPFGQFFHEKNKACDYKDNVPGCLQSGGSKIGGSIGGTCTPLRSGHIDLPCDADEVCQKIDAPEDGRYLCPFPFTVWYGPLGTDTSDQWTIATDGLRCGEDGRWYNGAIVVNTPAVDCTAKRSALAAGQDRSYGSAPAPPQRAPALTDNAKAAALNACPGMFTGKEAEGIPCAAEEVCQGINRPKNGRYSCEAPFSVWYGPKSGSDAQWKQAKEALVCGADGFWYDSGVKVDANAIDCTAKKSAFQKKENDDTTGCPSLSTNDREIPCKGDAEVCQPILKAVAGKYACLTPYRVWYGPRNGVEADWKQAKDALICKSGAWFDGDIKIDATAVDCTVKKIDCSKLEDGPYNGEPGQCSTHFWMCSQQQATILPCAPSLFFDDFTKECNYKEFIESCGGHRREPSAATTTTPSPLVAADATKTETDCPTILTDSTLPCKKDEACVAPADPINQKYLCETPYALWFGPKNNADQWRQAPNGIQCKSGQWFNGEEQIAPEAVHCTTPKFACSGKKDGSYSAHADKCTAYFWNCAHDDAFLYTCPAGLFFDVDTLSCDYKEVIVTCGGVKKDSTAVGVPSSDAIKASFDCSGKDNGYHEEGKCQKKFWNCADGKAFQIDCPEGLVYDGRVLLCQYPAACDAELPVTTTPAVPSSTLDHGDISQKPALPTTSFDCATQPDGLYAEKKCHKQYVQCTNGRTFAKECPAGLVYTLHTQSCDYKQICMNPPAATTAAPSTTSATPAADASAPAYATYERTPVTTTTQAPVAPPTFDVPNCANLEDGAHAMARCGQDFFLCWQGQASFSKCTDGLIFNPLNTQCDYRSNVIECGAAPAEVKAADGAAPPSPPTTAAPDLFCEGRGDGHFGSGCKSFFYSCQGGATTKMFCPMGLHYDAESKTCDLRELIVACGGKKESTTAAPTTAAYTGYVPFKPTGPTKDVPMPPVDNFCSGKVDGFYTDGCQKFFYSCHNGKTYKMICPTDLFYDALNKACNRREEIVACGAAPSTTTEENTTPAAVPTSSTSSYLPMNVVPAQDIPVAPITNFCAGKLDAFYGDGCQAIFYSCQNGVTYKMDCPAGLYYDAAQKKCDRREEIVACGGTPTTTQAPVTNAADVPAAVMANYCEGKKDGFYTLGCASFFYSCQSGATYKMTCPSGLYYDLSKRSCLNKEEIAACGATPTPAAAAPVTATTAAPAPYPAKAADAPVAPVENFCAGKTNGMLFGSGCQNVFYNCHDGVSYKTTCGEGLFFDADTRQCNYRENIVICGGKKQEVTAAPIIPALDKPVVAVEYFCVGKEDGFYGVGCATYFYTCQGGASFKMNCPSGLYYEQTSKHCDRKEEIATCGAVATSTPSIALAPTPAAYSTATAAPIAPSRDQQVIPLITNENFCTGKVDGFYGDNGCAGYFFSCSNGLTAKMLCPAGLFYDIKSKQCDNREDIVACGGAARPVAPVTLAAAPVSPSQYVAQPVEQPAPTTAAPVRDVVPVVSQDKYCVGKADGVYSIGCDSFYYSCLQGLTYKMACPSNLFYEITTSVCDLRENVVACGGKKPVVNPVAPLAHTQPAPTVDLFCKGKADGFYGLGCAGHFYSCNNGYTYKMLCPSGLFYDISVKACNNREKVATCGAVSVPVAPAALAPALPLYPAPVAPVVPAAAVPTSPLAFDANFCAGKVNGIYTVGCADWYYNCGNGYTYKMICAAGLFFDAPTKRCDIKENVVECGGRQPPPQTLPQQAQPLTQYQPAATTAPVRDVAPVSNFCSGKANGIYAEGCANFYYNCANEYTYKMVCGSSNLFYDVTTKRCDMKENVAACGGQQPQPQILPQPVPQQAQPQTQYQPAPTTAAPLRDVAPVSNFCSGKVDGIYAEGCVNFYYNCANGYTYKMVCGSSNLFYDVTSKRCDMKENVAACGGQQPQPQILPQPVPQQAQPQSQYQPAPTTAAPVRDVTAPVSNFCSGKVDGIYAEGCVNFYYNCANGYTYKMVCGGSNLFYDATTKRCDMKENVVACGGQQPQPQILPQPQQAQPQTQYQPAPTTRAPVRDVAPASNFCSGKIDGIYTEGCVNYYYNCASGYTYKMFCGGSNLFYDVTTKRCDLKENVAACGAQQPQLAQPQTQYQPAPTTTTPVRDVAPVSNFCSGKIDGIYAEGCVNFYYNCANGYTYKMSCGSNLFYDVTTKRCEAKETVVACGAQQPQQAQPQTQYQPAPTTAPVRDVAPNSNFCSGKANGLYPEGCASFYYNCYNGFTNKMACPAGLFYNAPTTRCEMKENVVACGGRPQVLPQPVPQQQQPQTQYVAPIAPVAPVRDVIVINTFCAGKADGHYADGCKNFFYYCTNGVTTKMDCSIGLFYSAATKQCEYIEKVVACGGVAPAAAVPAAPAPPGYNAPAASYSRPATTLPAKDIAKTITHTSCVGKENAFFGEGCNSFFYSCIEGKAYKMACPAGLFYDIEFQSCEYRDHVSNCGGSRPTAAPTPAPALDTLPLAPINNHQCNGKVDGFYAVADCSEEYFSCQAGLMRKEACKTGLIYNEVNNMCDWRENIVKCGARDTLPTRAPAAAEYGRATSRPITTAPKYDSHKEEQQKPRKPALSPSGASCGGQGDGYYASGCSADYTACVNGQSMAMHCPSDLRYSASTLMCDYSDNVPECGGQTPVVAKDDVVVPHPTIQPVVPIPPRLTIPTQPPVKEVHPRCAGRADGIYALAPCSQNYLACVDEKANIGLCRDDLFYSTSSGLCDWKDKIAACTMLVRPTPLTTRSIPSTTPVPLIPSSDIVRPTGDRLIRPTAPLGYQPDCSKIADGIYAINDCSPHYSRCANGRLTAHGTCPTGTFFSSARGSCLDKNTFTSCSAPLLVTSPPTQAPFLAPPAQPNYGVQPAQQQPQYQPHQQAQPTYQQQQPMTYQQQPQQQQYAPSYSATYGSDIYADPSQFCYGKTDGIYGATCSKSYVICSRGATLGYTCPNDFVFVRERAVCDHPSRVAQCGGAASYGYTAAAPAYQQQQSYGYTSQAQQPSYQQQTSYTNY